MFQNSFLNHSFFLTWPFISAGVFLLAGLVSSLGVPFGGLTQDLYNSLLRQQTEPVFFAFERTILIPSRRAQNETITRDGRSILVVTPEKDYFAFLRTTSGMVISYSQEAVVTSPDRFGLADSLYGFDGAQYWLLNKGQWSGPALNGGSVGANAPPQQLGQLIVVPKSEMALDNYGHGPNILSETITEHLRVGLQVQQLGCDEFISGPPVVSQAMLSYKVANSSKVVLADLDIDFLTGMPRTIKYRGGGRLNKRVEILPEIETIRIWQGADGRTNTLVSYLILVTAQVAAPERAAT